MSGGGGMGVERVVKAAMGHRRVDWGQERGRFGGGQILAPFPDP